METKGQRIRKLRKGLKLTQKDLGKLIGVSAPTVTLWEKDETSPTGDNADKLVGILNTSWEYLKTGKNNLIHHSSGTGKTPVNFLIDKLATPLYDRTNTALHLNSRAAAPVKNVSAIAIPEKLRSPSVFAMVEDMDGLAPVINKQDYVFISPDMPLKTDTNSMFWVNDTPIIGIVTKSPIGMTLRFISQAPGWEPIQVEEKDYIGRVIAIDPVWAREQREG